MKVYKSLLLLPLLVTLQGCLSSGPTRTELIQKQVQPLAKGVLPDCEEVFGQKFGKWTQCSSGKPIVFDGSTIYTGTWIDGQPNGKGKMVYADKSVYEGAIKEGYRHGKGKLINGPHGTIYEGMFVIGKFEGTGSVEFKIEGSHEGGFKDWQAVGQGVRTLADGIVVEGIFNNWNAGSGDAKVTFKDGSVWTGPHRNLWSTGSTSKGKVRTAAGELVDANIKTVGVRSCSSKPGTCGKSFELEVVGLLGCNQYAPKNAEYSAKGLPLQVGPIFLGMSYENFQCVMQNKFKDVTGENAITQGMLLEFGTPVSLSIPMDGDEIRFAKASLYSTSVEVSNLFSIPNWLRKPGETGQVFGGQIEVLFWNNQLATVKLGQPSVPDDYLIDKYGRPRLDTKTHNEKCVLGNRVVSSVSHFISTKSWQDSGVKVIYETGAGLEGGALATDSFIFGTGELPRCSANIYPKNVYQLVDVNLLSKYALAKSKEEAEKKVEDRKLYQGF